MSGKRARHRRQHSPPDADVVEILWDTGRWVRLEDASARTGIAGPTTQAFLDYCLMRGYVRPANGPGSPGDAITFRRGTQYWHGTPGLYALYLAGAAPDTPVPVSLRDLLW